MTDKKLLQAKVKLYLDGKLNLKDIVILVENNLLLAEDICRKHHLQICDKCLSETCGDNTNPHIEKNKNYKY